jgi:hypothetical protein
MNSDWDTVLASSGITWNNQILAIGDCTNIAWDIGYTRNEEAQIPLVLLKFNVRSWNALGISQFGSRPNPPFHNVTLTIHH